jgi:hypothetical protein
MNVYFPHYFDMFNGLIEDWYTEQLGVDYAKLILNDRYGFPFVHIETDFNRDSPDDCRSAMNIRVFRHYCKTDASCGRLPTPRVSRTVVEWLIWLFSLAFGRTPPVDCL